MSSGEEEQEEGRKGERDGAKERWREKGRE